MGQNEWNSKAIKSLLDAQMIEHLIQRQDVEDRKNLMMLGVDQQKSLSPRDTARRKNGIP